MKNKALLLCITLLCVLCIASLGVLGLLEFKRGELRASVTIETRSITGVNGGSVRHLTLAQNNTMADDYVALAKNAPIWYTDPDNRAFVFFGSKPADAVKAVACDMHGNEIQLSCAQNIIELPQANGQYTIGVWADQGRDTALYAFRVHIIGD